MNYAIYAHHLSKHFYQIEKGKKVPIEAVNDVDLEVNIGEIFGFLGPNGAGKTTTMRMLTTLLPIDGGESIVSGFDVKKQPQEVRRHIGYVGQLGGSDYQATGFENLMLQGELYGMSREHAKKRIDELIQIFDLKAFINRKVKTYSGGQKRRLELALGIIHQPKVLFLDEPTIGLDPQNRANLWEQIRILRNSGTTIFLTTHYLEEADELCDRLCIMDDGKIVSFGTPRELKQQISGDVIILKPKMEMTKINELKPHLDSLPYVRESRVEKEVIHLYVEDGNKSLPLIFDFIKSKDIELISISLQQPSLDDVYLKQTGRSLRDTSTKEVK